MRLAKRIVKVVGIITQNRGFKAPLEYRGIYLSNSEKVSCHGVFYYLQCGKPHIMSSVARIFANGPTIKGGCVSRRSIRAVSWFFSQKMVPVQGGYGTCFCRPGANLIGGRTCRGTNMIESSHLSRYCYFINSSGAIAVQALRICHECRSKSKNRDKQLTFIVRVRRSSLLIIQIDYL